MSWSSVFVASEHGARYSPRALRPTAHAVRAVVSASRRTTPSASPAAVRNARAPSEEPHKHNGSCLIISNLAAWGVPDADSGMGEGTSDPYIVFKLHGHGGETCTRQTPTVWEGGRNVTWNDEVRISIPSGFPIDGAVLEADVWDEDEKDEDDLMGKIKPLALKRDGGRCLRKNTALDVIGHGKLYDFKLALAYEWSLVASHEPEDVGQGSEEGRSGAREGAEQVGMHEPIARQTDAAVIAKTLEGERTAGRGTDHSGACAPATAASVGSADHDRSDSPDSPLSLGVTRAALLYGEAEASPGRRRGGFMGARRRREERERQERELELKRSSPAYPFRVPFEVSPRR